MNHARVIKVDGSNQDLDHQPTLKEAQEIVGGYVEFLKAKEDKTNRAVTLVVNEEGRLINLPRNLYASIGYTVGMTHFPLVGNVIVLYGWKTVLCD